MLIDQSKVLLKEKDIEDYLWENPQVIAFDGLRVVGWIKRQYSMPSGFLDLLGFDEEKNLVVVEVKNVAIDSSALTQVCRYAHDVGIVSAELYRLHTDYKYRNDMGVHRVVVGRSIDHQSMYEAESLGVSVITFGVQLSLALNSPDWTSEYRVQRSTAWRQMSLDKELHEAVKNRIAYIHAPQPTEEQVTEAQHILEDVEAALATE